MSEPRKEKYAKIEKLDILIPNMDRRDDPTGEVSHLDRGVDIIDVKAITKPGQEDK